MTQQPEHVEEHWDTAVPGDRVALSPQRGARSGGEQHERGRDSGPWAGGASPFERVPPQDLDAEQSVLGGMLLSKDAIADVVEVLKGHDFYRPAHETVFQAILDLYAKGEPADPITVAAELTKRGEIGRVGGPGYLHTLVQSVPTAANAEYYAEIVHEQAVLRRLVEAGTRITQMGYAADGDVDEIVNSAQSEIYAVTEERTSEDYLPLAEIMEGALDEIEAIGSRSGQMTGVPTGFTDLDSLTNGLHPGQMIVIAARPAMGKALALDTPLPTPTGWTTMGEVASGDHLLNARGRPTRVTAATAVLTGRPCYEVTFDDGTTVVADADHQWLTDARAAAGEAHEARYARDAWDARTGSTGAEGCRARRTLPTVKTTREIAGTLHGRAGDGLRQHRVVNTACLELPRADLPVPAYTLGAWLGAGADGTAHIAVGDPEILMRIEADGFTVQRPDPAAGHHIRLPDGPPGGLEAILRTMGVLDGKHIPRSYLRGSAAQRRALLAGLLDAAGEAGPAGSLGFAVTGRRLAEDVRELVVSLGHRCRWSTGRVTGGTEEGSTLYEITFTTPEDVFLLDRKHRAHKERRRDDDPRAGARFITAVRPVPSVPVRCVQVDDPEHLYLATRSMVPTHNSTLALDFARACSIRHNMPSVIFSLEMGRNEIAMRLLSAEARVALHHMRSGSMTDEDWTRLARQMPAVTEAPLYIDDSPNLSMMEIRAKCRRLKQRNDLKLIVIDYLQLMQTGGSRRPESRQQEVSEMSRNLKLLAKELEVPVIALSQLNRGPEQRTDKKPMVSDLRESGCLTDDTTLLRADTGAPVTFRDLLDNGHEGVVVWSLDERRRLVPAPLTHVFPSGVKPVYRMRLASGREVKATGNHRFLTCDGWRPLGDLDIGGRIAVPRVTREPLGPGLGWSEHRIGLLAHLIKDGCVVRRQPVRYTSNNEAYLEFVESAAAAEFGVTPRRVVENDGWHSYLPAPYGCADGRFNPVQAWFRELGIENLRPHEKRVPDVLHSAGNDEVALFLRHLWATDGGVPVPRPESAGAAEVTYSTSSRALADGVVLLLSRFGIIAGIRKVPKTDDEHAGYAVTVSDGPGLREFRRRIGTHGRHAEALVRSGAESVGRSSRTDADTLPGEAREAVAEDDVFWDRVVEIEPLGEQPVYDATVKGTHNFVADGIVAHNSIEQDADMVVLLHREDAYEKESPRAGEADLIVAKHRNGPTATITVAFQGHYSRFVDMANGM